MTRPSDGYEEEGARAFTDGVAYTRCPHRLGTLKSVEWAIGWQMSAAELGDGDEAEQARDQARALKADRTVLVATAQRLLPDATRVASAIRIPLSKWPGNCMAIADALAKSGLLKKLEKTHGKPKVLYGVFHGATGRHFQNRGQTHHAWIEFPDTGLVVDPTRWVFDQTEPALTATTAGTTYDLAGARLRARYAPKDFPAFDPKQRSFVWKADRSTDAFLRELLGLPRSWNGMLSLNQMFWIANLPVDRLHPKAEEIYRFIEEVGCIAMVPLDNLNYVSDGGAAPSP